MKKTILLLFLLIEFIGCTTMNMHKLMQPGTMELDPKLHKLYFQEKEETVSVIPANEYNININSKLYTLFEREMKNMCKSEKEYYGHMEITIIYTNINPHYWISLLSGLTLMIPNIFGMPMASGTGEVEFEVKIFDIENEIVWENIYYDKVTKFFTMYQAEAWGDVSAINRHIILLYKELIYKMKQDLQKDVGKINIKLESQMN